MSTTATLVTATVSAGHVLTQEQADAVNAMARALEESQSILVAGGTMLQLGMPIDHTRLVQKGMAAFEALCHWQKTL
jgi:hypothetical protein